MYTMDQKVGYYLVPGMNVFNLPFTFLPTQNQNLCFIVPPNPVLLSSVETNNTPDSPTEAAACLTWGSSVTNPHPTNRPSEENIENSVDEEILPDFRCKVCSALIPTFSEFQVHLLTHSAEPSEECDIEFDTELQVPEESKKVPSILQPLRRDGKESGFPCPYCPKKFQSRPAMSEHVLQHRITKDIFCVLCKSTFASILTLRKHLLMFHCKDRDRRQCTYCNYRCFQNSDLEKHIARRHTRDFRFNCLLCVKGFATPKELKNHEIRKHLNLSKDAGDMQ